MVSETDTRAPFDQYEWVNEVMDGSMTRADDPDMAASTRTTLRREFIIPLKEASANG
jgi:hypothetical protein